MRGLVVFAFDPGPQPAVEGVESVDGGEVEMGEPGSANGAEVALDFSLPGGLVGPGVDECDAEFGAHQGKLAGAVGGSVVDVKSSRLASAQEGLLEHGQEGGGVLGEGEGGEGDDAGGVVDEGDEVGLAALSAIGNGGTVHDIGHPIWEPYRYGNLTRQALDSPRKASRSGSHNLRRLQRH